jgi:chorismate dehydratase
MEQMLRWHDAALLIGDPALKAQTKGYYVFDLAAEWRRWTGRPFVFAFWAVRKSALQGLSSEIDVPRIFQQSRDNGLAHIAEIASTWTERLHLPAEMITEYLTQNVDYYLDPDNLEGLRLFFRYGAECKVLPPAPEIHFLAQPKFAAHR